MELSGLEKLGPTSPGSASNAQTFWAILGHKYMEYLIVESSDPLLHGHTREDALKLPTTLQAQKTLAGRLKAALAD